MQATTAWRVLGIGRTDDAAAIRRAYADMLRAMDPDADPAAYARLREARDVALRLARSGAEPAAENADASAVDADTAAAQGEADPGAGTIIDIPLPPTPVVTLGEPPRLDRPVRGTLTPADYPPAAPLPPRPAVVPIPHDRIRFGATRYDIGYGDPALTITYQLSNDAADVAFATLWSLLQPTDGRDTDTSLSPEETATALHAADIVLSDPKLADIDYRQSVDAWMADLLARTVPRSDPLVGPVAQVLDWKRRGQTVDANPAVAFLADRIDTNDFIDAVRQPDHRYHRAWRAVSAATPDSIRPKYLLSKRRVRALLSDIRKNHPSVEDYLDPTEVHRWQGTMITGPNLWIWGVLVIVFLRVLILAVDFDAPETPSGVPGAPSIADTGSSDPPPALRAGESDTLKDMRADLDIALLRVQPGFDLARVRKDNPALARELEAAWTTARDDGIRLAPFLTQVATLLTDRFDAALPTAGYDDLRAWVTLKRTILVGIAQRGDTMCSDYLMGDVDPTPFLNRDYFRARDDLMVKVLLRAGTIPPNRADDGKRTYSVSADVVDAITRQAGLSRDTVIDAMVGKGTPRARCKTQVALYDTVLDLPRREALKLMRLM